MRLTNTNNLSLLEEFMSILTFDIDIKSKTHLYIQIYEYIKEEIKSGRLEFNNKLPSTRLLAQHLQVSRNTIEMSYGQLIDEGYIISLPKRGYFVCDIQNHIFSSKPLEAPHQQVTARADAPSLYEFSPYGVDLENFPFSTWRKVMKEVLYDIRNDYLFEAGHPQGDVSFREAIATYLHQSRGVNCDAGQIIVGAGTDYLIILLSQILGKTTHFAIENPSYKQAYRILSHAGFQITSVNLDSCGMSIKTLEESPANVAYVTPSHHFPLGIVMPIKRRLELLAWANQSDNRYIIEDDYDSEFRYKGKPIPSLQGIDTEQKVIYIGTFTKAIAPSIRIGYLVLPKQLLVKYKENYAFYSNTVPRIEQYQLAEFINLGYFERHLNRMRNTYKNKRDLIIQKLSPYRSKIKISGENSGLHMLIEFPDESSETDVLRRARSAGLKLIGLSEYYQAPPESCHKPTILLGYASLKEAQIQKNLEVFINTLLL